MNHRILGIGRRILVIAMLFVLLCGQALAASMACYVNTNTKVYQKASTSSKSLNVKKNTTVTMTDYTSTWAKVKKNGVTAYIPLKYLNLKDRLGWYIKSDTYLYKSTSTSSKKICSLPKGQKVYVVNRNGDYFGVENEKGTVRGYVKVSSVSSKKPSVSSSNKNSGSSSTPAYSANMSDSQKIEFIIQVAESLKNKPYASKANPPKTFDCSRYVKYCFEQAKIKVKSTAKDQGYDGGFKKISSISSLKRGDVVCFNTNGSDGDLSDHTGIYLGNGNFIHASSSAGKVIVSTLSSGYYKTNFSWGRRVL